MQYERRSTVDLPFERAVPEVVDALAAQGFGVLTSIDVQAVLRSKRGSDIEPYLILGDCNPDLAARALDVDRGIGVLLPCSVVVRAVGEHSTTVQVFDPLLMTTVVGREEPHPVAADADQRLRRVLDSLPSGTTRS